MKRTQKSQKRTKFLLLLIVLTAILSLTATYAWFSTQRDVDITGMKLNVEVAESMQISLDGEKWAQSIQIANMRQFYGTYTGTADSFAIYQANTDENTNYVPTELMPVSTTGAVAAGKLTFVQGTIATNADGSTKLTGITACSEADIVTGASVATKQGNNTTHPYLVFDMYLRNVSARTSGNDPLEMNIGSRVWIDTTSSTDQEGVGVTGTGLEYSARIGFIPYANTLPITESDDADLETGKTVAQKVRALTAGGSEKAAIWEPNFREHTQYVVNNNGRGITSTSQAVDTYGVLTTASEVQNVNAENDATNLAKVTTFRPEYSTVEGGTTAKEIITDTTGAQVGLVPNAITKVRVYIWLEGQDPDCVDLASTGDKLNVTIKLTKEPNSKTNNTYDGTGSGS